MKKSAKLLKTGLSEYQNHKWQVVFFITKNPLNSYAVATVTFQYGSERCLKSGDAEIHSTCKK